MTQTTMVWYFTKPLGCPGFEDNVYQNTNLFFNIHSSTYSSFDLYHLWQAGVNIFNIDRTTHDHEFLEDMCTKIEKARDVYSTEVYRPIGVAVTMSAKTPVQIDENVDIIIVKDISNKDDLFKFRKIYSILNKPILVWISSDKSDDINFIIKLSDGVVYDFYEDDVILSDSTYVFKKCKEMHKPIILSRPIEVEEYTNNIMKLMPSAHKLDALSLDGIVLEDTKNQKNIAHDVYNVFIALVRIDLIKENEQRIREYMEIRAELKLPVLPPLSVAHAACLAAVNSEATLIIVLSRSGRSAKWVSLARPPCHIVVITTQASTARKLHVYKQIIPLFYNQRSAPTWRAEYINRINFAVHFALKNRLLAHGARFVVLSQRGDEGYCNSIQILKAHDRVMFDN